MERTLVVFKPDAVQRRIVGEILGRFERKGLKIVAMKMLTIDTPRAERMYSVHAGKEFYERLVAFMTCAPVVAVVLEGLAAVEVVRSMVGPTFGPDGQAGTIRGDFGMSRRYNLIHASDSLESAQREIDVFFAPREIQDYSSIGEAWIYDMTGPEPI
ncbi:MAG: nucleoside-diphosphate kinase [Planctomycetes bacterium]|nr:nucleoside-diphosphate kinase [Planctomycetota bacterium]